MSTSSEGTGTDKLASLREAGPTLLAIVGVLAAIFFLFDRYRTSRLEDLERLYARGTAHVGRQAELKLESFSDVINNLRPDAHERALDSDALLQALAAKNRLELTTQAQRAAGERHAEISSLHTNVKQKTALAKQLHDQVQREAQRAPRQTQQFHLEIEQALGKVLSVQQLESGALEHAAKSSLAAQKRAQAAQEAALNAERAARGLRALEEARRDGRLTGEEQASASEAIQQAADAAEQQTAAGAQRKPNRAPATAAKAASAAADQQQQATSNQGGAATPAPASDLQPAQEASRRAQNAAVTSANEARTATDEATRVIETARGAAARARDVEGAFDEKFNELLEQLKSKASADANAQRVAREYTQRADELKAAREPSLAGIDSDRQREVITNSLAQAGSANMVAGALQKRVLAGALPSYHRDLMQCLGVEQVDAEACLMRASARMRGLDPRIFQFTSCPADVQGDAVGAVWLNESKRTLVYVLDRTLEEATACIQVPLSELLPKTARGATAGAEPQLGTLDEVLLVGPTGNVLQSRQSSAIRIDRLQRFDPKTPTASSMLADTELGAQSFREFRQPIDVPITPPCKKQDGCDGAAKDRVSGLTVVGFVDEARLDRESTRFRPASFLWVALAIAALLLALPLLKLFLVQATSRYDRLDCTLLGTGATLATFVATLALWSCFANQRLHQDLETRLEDANTAVRQALEKHLDQAVRLLVQLSTDSQPLTDALGRQHADEPRTRLALESECTKPSQKFKFTSGTTTWLGFDRSERPWIVCERAEYDYQDDYQPHYQDDYQPHYHYDYRPDAGIDWQQFIYMNQQGFHLAKFSPEVHAPAPVDSSNRAGFRRALARKLGCLRQPTMNGEPDNAGDSNCEDLSAAVDVVRTATSGDVTFVVARPAPPNAEEPAGVTALATNVTPLTNLPLPRGIALAVVDSEGKVLLHSDNDAQHGHSIFDDVDDALALRALLNSRATRELDLRYQGEPVRFAISYLPGPDWHVITVGSRNLADVAITDTVLITLAGMACCLLAEFLLVGAYLWHQVRNRRRRKDHVSCTWFRPHAHLASQYARTTLWVLVIATLGCFSLCVSGLPLIATLIILLAACGVGLWLPHATSKDDKQTPARKPGDKQTLVSRWLAWPAFTNVKLSTSYCAWLFSLTVAGIVIPASIWFTAAYDHVSESIIRADQAFYAQARRDDPDHDCSTTFGTKRNCDPTRGTYAGAVSLEGQQAHLRAHHTTPATTPFCLSSILQCVVRHLPTLGSAQFCEGRLHEASLTGDINHEREWVREQDRLEMFLHEGTKLHFVSSQIPSLFRLEGRGWTWFFLILAALVAAVFGVSLSQASLKRQLFLPLLVRLQTPPTIAANDRRLLLRGIPSEEAASKLGATPLEDISLPSDVKKVFVRDLSATLNDAVQRSRLEALIRGRARIVAFSPRPLLEVRALHDNEELRREWVELLKGFREAAAPVRKDPGLDPDAVPSKAYMHWLWQSLPDSQRRVLGQLTTQGFVTPDLENEEVVDYLVRRGILSQDTLAVCNRHFAEFVQSQVSDDDMSKWEGTGGQWERLRHPLWTAVVALIGTTAVSAPELAMTGAVAPAVAVGLPAILRILTSLALRPG